ncbi:hypothetical protein [Streptomyces sp. NPDC007346]|uniref:hypothetical protein n=1 Tax=Streptomyces sp. NPDC007346 TaxID=3154682 RepID=UPI00345566E8
MGRRWVPALVLGGLWWWAVLRLALQPEEAGVVEGAVAAGGWGLSLLPVHVASGGSGGVGRAVGSVGPVADAGSGGPVGEAGSGGPRGSVGSTGAERWAGRRLAVGITRAWRRRRPYGRT